MGFGICSIGRYWRFHNEWTFRALWHLEYTTIEMFTSPAMNLQLDIMIFPSSIVVELCEIYLYCLFKNHRLRMSFTARDHFT